MLKNSLFSPLCSTPFFCFSLFLSFFQRRTSLSFLFVFQPLTFASALLFFSFGSRVPFFSAQNNSLFSPNTFFSAQTFFNFSAQTFFSFSSATLLFFFFSALFFSTCSHYILPFFSPSVEPKTFFNSAQNLFQFKTFFSLAQNIFFSCSTSLYLSKYSFSSNLK